MKAGRELDALVAEKVMGWVFQKATRPFEYPGWSLPNGDFKNIAELPPVSTNIAAAWQVVEKVRELTVSLNNADGWECCFSTTNGSFLVAGDEEFYGRASTAPHAICLAALRAMGVLTPAPEMDRTR